MGLSVSLVNRGMRCCECGHGEVPDDTVVYLDSITHNLIEMAQEAGIYQHLWRPEELGITRASQLVEPLREGWRKLRSDPGHYRRYDPSNGWGRYDDLVAFVRCYLSACERNPVAEVEVDR